MSEWFVYCDAQYYPWAEIIEAGSPEEALVKMEATDQGECVVLPADAVVFGARGVLEGLRERGKAGLI